MIQLIFSDIDGTLLNSAFLVTERAKKSIKKAVQNGKVFVPISARMPEAIEPIIGSSQRLLSQSLPVLVCFFLLFLRSHLYYFRSSWYDLVWLWHLQGSS